MKKEGLLLAGVDEAGRGPLAGPVVTAAAVLTPDQEERLLSMGLKDSKKMTALRRDRVFDEMISLGVIWRAQAASVARIDKINILNATLWAMNISVGKLPGYIYDGVIVDGNKEIPGLSCYQEAVVGADDSYPQVSAASVVAKVLRDRVMIALDRLYPEYSFAKHKGYGTKVHREALALYGPSPVHRKSFKWRRP